MSLKGKMIGLIVVGFVLSIITMRSLQSFWWMSWDIYLMVAITFYPLAIVYGRAVMADIFQGLYDGPYSLLKRKEPNKPLAFFAKGLNFIFAAVVFLFIGWIYGTYTAYQKYIMQKGSIIK